MSEQCAIWPGEGEGDAHGRLHLCKIDLSKAHSITLDRRVWARFRAKVDSLEPGTQSVNFRMV
jgi:hypothetical protein